MAAIWSRLNVDPVDVPLVEEVPAPGKVAPPVVEDAGALVTCAAKSACAIFWFPGESFANAPASGVDDDVPVPAGGVDGGVVVSVVWVPEWGMYVMEGHDIVYYNSVYYYFHGGRWWISQSYTGPWAIVVPPPPVIGQLPPGHLHGHLPGRGPGGCPPGQPRKGAASRESCSSPAG